MTSDVVGLNVLWVQFNCLGELHYSFLVLTIVIESHPLAVMYLRLCHRVRCCCRCCFGVEAIAGSINADKINSTIIV